MEGINKGTYKGLGASDELVETLSTGSTILALTLEQQNKLLLWGGNAASARILLPQAQAGLNYKIYFTDDGVSSATKIVSSGGTDDIYYPHINKVQTTGQAVSLGTTLEGGSWVEMTGISSVRWVVAKHGPPSSVNDVNLGTTSTG
jgi:hypothetical protein